MTTNRVYSEVHGGGESIQQKALRIFRAGQVRREHGDVYTVRGDHGTYTVDLYSGGCDCPARTYCSHECAAEILRSKTNAETAESLRALRPSECRECRGAGTFISYPKLCECSACGGSGVAA